MDPNKIKWREFFGGWGGGRRRENAGFQLVFRGIERWFGERAGGVTFPENSSIAAFLRTGERGFLSKGLQRTCLEINWNNGRYGKRWIIRGKS